MLFNVGDKVWIFEKSNGWRQGKVVKIYPCFILVWIYGRLGRFGWHGCFLWHDVKLNVVVSDEEYRKIKQKTKFSSELGEKVSSVG